MSAPARIATFAVILAVVFAGAALAGTAVNVDVADDGDGGHGEQAEEHAPESGADSHSDEESHVDGQDQAGDVPGGHTTVDAVAEGDSLGLASASEAYRLVLDETVIQRGAHRNLSFRILDSTGVPVRAFDLVHARRMHLIVVRRDFRAYQHLHPRLLPDGRWVAAIDASQAGVYRAFADFSAGGAPTTLGADVFVPGRFRPQLASDAWATADARGGYVVAIDGPPSSGGTEVAFTVERRGEELDAVQPYLGARGHLVALREGDLAYLHTHPHDEPGEAGGVVSFTVEYPGPGRYRLYFQFKHRGEVRTAAFTQVGVE